MCIKDAFSELIFIKNSLKGLAVRHFQNFQKWELGTLFNTTYVRLTHELKEALTLVFKIATNGACQTQPVLVFGLSSCM